jgi:hypothetical protein
MEADDYWWKIPKATNTKVHNNCSPQPPQGEDDHKIAAKKTPTAQINNSSLSSMNLPEVETATKKTVSSSTTKRVGTRHLTQFTTEEEEEEDAKNDDNNQNNKDENDDDDDENFATADEGDRETMVHNSNDNDSVSLF